MSIELHGYRYSVYAWAVRLVPDALEALHGGGDFMVDDNLTLADLYALPHLAYFNLYPDGAALLNARTGLRNWLGTMAARPSYRETAPPIPALTA